MSGETQGEFFVGYADAPPGLSRFALKVIGAMLAGALLFALALGYAVQDRGGGRFSGDVKAVGVLENAPYPILRTAPSAAAPQGHTFLVAGGGKNGVAELVKTRNGAMVELRGFALKRGALDMIVIDGESQAIPVANASPLNPPAPVSLGRYRIAGEICDGKCYPGGMRPGVGLAHKACANLCIDGGQPAVLATLAPVQGQSFLLLANRDGGMPPSALRDYTGLPIELEGDVVRAGDLLILRADWSTIKKQ